MPSKLEFEDVKAFIEGEEGNGCKLKSTEYINSNQILLIECKCENKFETTFSKFKSRNKRQCNDCGGKRAAEKRAGNTYTYSDDVLEKMNEKYYEIRDYIDGEQGNGCILITTEDEYKNTKTKLKIKCSNPNCNEIFEVGWFEFKNRDKRMCTNCTDKIGGLKRRVSIEKMKLFIEVGSESGCILHSTSSNGVYDKLEIECKCGIKFEKSYHKFKDDNQRCCSECSKAESKGERRVRKYLEKEQIEFKPQYIFDDCKNDSVLKFDFAVIDYKSNIICLIEYDGRQHYEPVEFWGGESNFIKIQQNDQIKNKYCKKNNIELIRIPYWDFKNIEKILEVQLGNLLFNEKYKEVI